MNVQSWSSPPVCRTSELFEDLAVPLRVTRKHLHWFEINDARFQSDNGCPCYFIEAAKGYFYGCPAISRLGLKVAEHSGGTEIHNPLTDSREPDETDSRRISEFLARHLPGVSSTRTAHKTCFYTLTPDEHFVVDRHPEHASVVFAAGLSGHGFKFTSALGKVLSELVLNEPTCCDISFLSIQSSRNRVA